MHMLRGFLNNVVKHPQHPVFITDDKTYSYAELMDIACRICSGIKKNDPGNTKLIGVYTDHGVHTYASIIAILLSGAGFVPLNKKFPEDKLQNIINSSGIDMILCNAASVSELNGLVPKENVKTVINDELKTIAPVAFSEEMLKDNAEEIAYILFTSGSTGIPKGIGITHANFAAFIQAMVHSGQYDFRVSDSVLQIFELSFDVSIACTFIAWEAGACLIPVSTEGIVFINALELIKQHNITVVTMAPSALAYMKQLRLLEEFDFPGVRYTFLTGEALPYNLAVAWKAIAPNSIIENAYGPTEVTVWSAMYRLHEGTQEEVLNGLAPIGKALPGLTARICDEQLRPLQPGEYGELLLYGEQVAQGYWKDAAKTATSFVKMDEQQFPGSWYRTGDIVVENKHGNIVYVNRKDNQVQINGFRVELGEIEFRIKEYTQKDSAVVVPFENENNTLTLLAFIEDAGDKLSDLKTHLAATLPVYMIPKKFYIIKSMPLNNSGKIDRKALLKMHRVDE